MTEIPPDYRQASTGGIIARLGRALHWTAIAISLPIMLMGIAAVLFPRYGDGMDNLLISILLALPIYGIGRLFRYVLAGE